MTATLVFDDVTLRYPGRPSAVVEHVTFDLPPGERVALLGLNGSGKTTLLKAIVGLVPHQGTITVCGAEVSQQTIAGVRDQVGFLFNVPEDQLLFPRVLDDVSYGLRRRGLERAAAIDKARDLLEQLGIAALAEQPVYDLSHGQKLRVALAGVLAIEPAVLLLDEPTAGLDPPGRLQLAGLLERQPAAVLVATHDLSFAEMLCDRHLLLDGGVVASGSGGLSSLRERWAMPSGSPV